MSMDKLQNKIFFYRVQIGDNIIRLSRRFKVSPFDIIERNKLKKEIEAGDIVIIENRGVALYKVSVTDTAKSIAKKFNISEDTLKMNNNGIPYVFYGLEIKV